MPSGVPGLLVQLRLALLIMLAEVAFCCWILEQPSGSSDVIPYHPRLDWLCNEVVYVSYLIWWLSRFIPKNSNYPEECMGMYTSL